MIACIFNIGTWHHHNEDSNVLVKLWKECNYTDLGVIQNQSVLHVGKEALELSKIAEPMDDGYKWINDGADSIASGITKQTNVNVEIVQNLKKRKNLHKVVIVGHSRGAILAIRIAAMLPDIGCHLFLYDPVKRMVQGEDAENREIGGNVGSIKVIVMEDQSFMHVDDFNLLTVKSRANGSPDRQDLENSEYTRLPGTHGTATQVTGHPIGRVGHLLAQKWLEKRGVKLKGNFSKDALLKAYCEISRKNPVSRNSFGTLIRKVNDESEKSGYKNVKVGGNRTAKLDAKVGKNVFMGTEFFVNEQHHGLFKAAYPTLCDIITKNTIIGQKNVLDNELQKLLDADPPTYYYILAKSGLR